MKKINLAIIRQKYRFDGGAERFICNMVEALNNKKIKITIITRKWLTKFSSNCNFHFCNPIIWNRFSRENNFAKAVKKYFTYKNFDLIQSHEKIIGCDIFRAGDGVHKSWLEKRKKITSSYKRYLTKISPYHNYILNTEYAMFNSPSLKKIICNSKMVCSDIIRYYSVPKEKIKLIYNAVDYNYFTPACDKQKFISRKKLLIPKQAFVFIYVGSGFERKGLYQAICAISTTNNYLIIIGRDKNLLLYKALARSLGCLSRLRFIGTCDNILPLYHAANVLVLPTLYDPFPNVILEAMSCGLPVITTTNCGGAEFIEEGKQGFIYDALDNIKLKEYINIISSTKNYFDMSNLSREKVKECSFTNISKKFFDLYQEILS